MSVSREELQSLFDSVQCNYDDDRDEGYRWNYPEGMVEKVRGIIEMLEQKGITVVHLEEEYGYRRYVFFFEGTMEALKLWWKGLKDTFAICFGGGGVQLDEKFHLGAVIEVDIGGSDECLGMPLLEQAKVYIHVHDNSDSILVVNGFGCLRRQDGEMVHHAGYVTDDSENYRVAVEAGEEAFRRQDEPSPE